jgi:hypothetical protein
VTDYLDRVRQAARKIAETQRERDAAIADAVRHGDSQTDAAKAANLTRQRVSQIVAGLTPGPERAFWGASDDGIQVAAGGKPEAPKDASGPLGTVLNTEVHEAVDLIRASAEAASIDVGYELIKPPGFVRLNRQGLIVICGPRLSPQVAEVLEADPVLAFAKDESCWHITDRETGTTWRSPLDEGVPADIGYIGRLSRPDGRGTFLYIAGIHAPGCAGGAHYITSNLASLWREVKVARFSALIRCGQTEAGTVAFSELIAGPYLHGK